MSLYRTKKDVGMRLFVQCFYALSLHLVSVVFGTAIPTSLYIFGLFTCISLAGTLLVLVASIRCSKCLDVGVTVVRGVMPPQEDTCSVTCRDMTNRSFLQFGGIWE